MNRQIVIESEQQMHLSTRIIISAVLMFLQVFMSRTLARRVIALILMMTYPSNSLITELTGMCDKSVRTLKKAVEDGEVESLFMAYEGTDRKSKLSNVEGDIVEEIERNNYHTRRQIADMIQTKFKINVSEATVGRFLKKKALRG